MDPPQVKCKKPNIEHFKKQSDEQLELILAKKNKENTHKATKLWMNCFKDYLIKRDLPDPDTILTPDLPQILEHFYASVSKKPKETDPEVSSSDEEDDPTEVNPNAAILPQRKKSKNYKNTSMKALHAGIARYYKEKRSIDIISNELFIHANSVFTGILQLNKESGLGDIQSKREISDFDMEILMQYF